MDDAHGALADLLADGTAAGEQLARLLDAIAAQGLTAALRLHRFRPRLQDVQLAVTAVTPPLDVHGAAVVALDGKRVTGQFLGFRIGEGKTMAIGQRDVHGFDGFARRPILGEHHLDCLGTQIAANNGRLGLLQHQLADVELIRVHRALHNRLAQAVAGRDEHDIAKTRFRIEGEHHAGCADIASHHALDAGGQRDFRVDEALVHAIGNRPVVIEGGENVLHGREHVVQAMNVEIGFLLAGEGGIGQIFRRGGRAHGNGDVAVGVLQHLLVGGGNAGVEIKLKRRSYDPLAHFGTGFRQRRHIIHVEAGKRFFDARLKVIVAEKIAESLGRGGESARHPHTGAGQLADHLAQAGVLAAHLLHITHAQAVEPGYVVLLHRHSL